MSDILDDLKTRLVAIGFENATIEKVVLEIRHDWAGERVYIGANYEFQRKHSERNRNIIKDYKAGESIVFLSRRYGLSRQRIWKIVNG
jgi:Mor family transcriptional regulator